MRATLERSVVRGVHRYMDPHFRMPSVKVFPGEHHVTRNAGEMLVTVLGSCVAACMRDPVARVGGMNHFMLPASESGDWGVAAASLRYGNFAMETLINDILKCGGRRERLEIKLFGGANVLAGGLAIGHRNAEFAETYLADEGLRLIAKDLRGDLPRRVHYLPETGAAFVQTLRRETRLKEREYAATLPAEAECGAVELFD